MAVQGDPKETEREWLTRHAADTAPPLSVNHQPERAARPVTDRLAATESLDGPFKLGARESRILTALAQYQQGRSKVQVAVLTRYAATGVVSRQRVSATTFAVNFGSRTSVEACIGWPSSSK